MAKAPPVGIDDLAARADALVEGVGALRERYARLEERLTTLPGAESAHSARKDANEGDGRRVVAVNLALSGTPVHEIDAYLHETFGSEDNSDVLDDLAVAPSSARKGKLRRPFSGRR